MNSNRIDLSWGGGVFSVLLDLRSRNLIPYACESQATRVHEVHGGKNYYRSCSGASGAGWIPGGMVLRTVDTYRVDTVYVEAPRLDGVKQALPGIGILAPINKGEGLAPDWPIVVMKGVGKYYGANPPYDELYMLDGCGLYYFLAGNEDEFEEREFVFRFFRTASSNMEEKRITAHVRKGVRLNYRQALVGLFNWQMRVQAEGENSQPETSPFWTRLGIWAQPGELFLKISQHVAWARYTAEELSTTEGLQAAAPKNVQVLAPNLYIQEGSNGFEAVGLFRIDGEQVEFELVLEVTEAIKAMGGDFADVLARLEEGARGKVAQARTARLQQEMWKLGEDGFLALCKEHGELEVTVADSLSAGNCRPGTESFREKTFGDRKVVKVKELVPHLTVYGVRRVLEHKLLPLLATAK